MNIEIFKDAVGFEGLYLIGNKGSVISLPRTVKSRSRATGVNTRTLVKKIMGLEKTQAGYIRATLSTDIKKKRFSVHRMVAMAFIPNPENKPCVNHVDGITSNNSFYNLEWCTYSENELHSFRVLGKKVKRSKETIEKIVASNRATFLLRPPKAPKPPRINLKKSRVCLNGIQVFNSMQEAYKATGCSVTSICNNLSGLSLKTKVGTWEYLTTN